MPKYLFHGSYTVAGLQGVLKEGAVSRRDTIAALVANMGGSMESFHFALGGDDIYSIVDLPDQQTAIALSLAVNGTGTVNIRTTVLITAEEADAAAQITVNYRPPGQ
jgi:uncharacterized protein with GYD domain